MKVSIIMPTYNDAISIEETLNSVVTQTYFNWELIIVDDGSTDNTKKIIDKFKAENDKDNQIKYIYQTNQDQLNAIINGLNYITGDYIYILHSDDLLASNDFFEKCVKIMDNNPKLDAIIGDLIIIDGNSNVTNIWKAGRYKNTLSKPALVLLNNGCNIYGDFAFHRRASFEQKVYRNYLMWNTPFWIDFHEKIDVLNVQTVNFPFFKYRIHDSNYVSNDIGKFNALNGELRTLINLMNFYYIPCYNFQSFVYKFLRGRGIRKFKLFNYYKPIYKLGIQKNKAAIIKKAIEKTYKHSYKNNLFLNNLILFYKNKANRTIKITCPIAPVYKGKDIRSFSKKLFNDELPEIYKFLIEQMATGFNIIEIDDKSKKEDVIDILKFLCIDKEVLIVIKGGGNNGNS